MELGGYRIDILVQGYPGKTVCHGLLGWSTIVLLRGHDRVALIDVGSFGIRRALISHLAVNDLTPKNVTDVGSVKNLGQPACRSQVDQPG